MENASRTPHQWSTLLKGNWEKLASSDYRDFFVASHPGWDDDDQWSAKARDDLDALLDGFPAPSRSTAHVLEIGCGVARLGTLIARETASYTGVDIAPSMLAEAARRCAAQTNARFFETDGLRIPEPARDRRYDLILAASVFIHCPRAVIESLVRDAFTLLADRGRLRFHVLADPHDPGGFASPRAYQQSRDAILAQMAETREATDQVQLDLIPDEHYMGDAFAFDEVIDFMRDITGGTVDATRLSIGHTVGWITPRRTT